MNTLAWSINAAAAAAVATMAYGSFVPTSRFWGKVHTHAPYETDGFAVTFDDGPTPNSTPAILDILGELGVKAAFFVIGENVRRYPDLVVRMHAEGHLVANHTMDHVQLAMFRGPGYWNRQLIETDRIIDQTIGVCPAMFRPPFGIKTFCIMGAAARLGKAVVTWNRRAWDGIKTTSERIIQRLGPPTQSGDVLLMHDGIEPDSKRDPSPTVRAVKPLILLLRDRGLTARPLDQLLKLPAYKEEACAKSTE